MYAFSTTNLTDTAKEIVALAQNWDGRQDLTNWWLRYHLLVYAFVLFHLITCSEKMDGVRAYWDGRNFVSRYLKAIRSFMYFRHGKELRVPSSFTQGTI